MRPEEMYLFDPSEKPLDRMTECGGFSGIFRRIGCIGDSLAAGEFESKRADGSTGFHDMLTYSWGSYIGRDTGADIVNMGRDLMTAEEFVTSYGDSMKFFDPAAACQAYIVALGVNDLFTKGGELGSIADFRPDDPERSAKNFAGYYGRLLSRLKAISPRCRLFLVSMPRQECEGAWNPTVEAHRDLLVEMTGLFSHSYVLDLTEYFPVQNDEIRKLIYTGSHFNPMGYMYVARCFESYIDWYIRRSPRDFAEVPFIGTDLSYYEVIK
ncbi:MAG: SGNH/GDSL hydrolase family protein [Clostridia bacterium]|nr:SGNH/GDSL hydrolase family protein [Clostridia bacterium]